MDPNSFSFFFPISNSIVKALHITSTFGPTGPINSILFGSGGFFFFTASDDGLVRKWNIKNGELLQVYRGQRWPRSLQVLEDKDVLISGGSEPLLISWEIQTARILWIVESNKSGIENIVIKPGERKIIANRPSYVDRVVAWNIDTRKQVRLTNSDTDYIDTQLHFSKKSYKSVNNDNNYISFDHGTIKVWNKERNKILHQIVCLDEKLKSDEYRSIRTIHDLAILPNGRQVVVASDEMVLRIWDIGTGSLLKTLTWNEAPIQHVAISTDGRLILASSFSSVRGWDLETGALCLDILKQVAVNAILSLPSASLVAAALSNGEIRIADILSGDLVATLKEHVGSVNDITVVPGGRLAVSGGDDGVVIVWNLESDHPTRRFEGHLSSVTHVAASPDGQLVAAGLQNGEIWFWDVKTGDRVSIYQGDMGEIWTLCFFPDSARLLATSSDQSMRILNARAGVVIGNVELPYVYPRGATFTKDGKRILACLVDPDKGKRNPIAVVDPESYEYTDDIFLDNPESIEYPVISEDGRLVAAIGRQQVLVFSLETKKEVCRFPCRVKVTSLAFIPGKPWLVSGDEGGDLIVWDLDSKDATTESEKAP